MAVLNQSPLLSLASELIQVIADDLTTDTIKNLCLTCKQLCECLSPRLFRNLTISFSRATFEREFSKVQTLATADRHAASLGTQTLKIASLSPRYDPEYRRPSPTLVDGEWVQKPLPEDPPEVIAVEKQLKGCLFKAIASLKCVQSVEYEPREKDCDWAQEAVWNALKTLPNLRVLLLHVADCKIPLPLYELSGIQEISVGGISENDHAEVLDNVAKLVARSPKITSINILSDWCYPESFNKSRSLHQIFKYHPRNSRPLQLRHLSLENCLVKLDNLTLPHLEHLTSLSLIDIEDPYNRRAYWGMEEPSNLQLAEEQNQYGSSHDDIWKALKISGIHLEELALDFIVPSFLEYLASYSGLKKLQLTPDGFLDDRSSDSMAGQFFSAPFTHHIHSLEELRVIPLYEGSWCFGPHNEAVISRCTNLKVLQMAIVSLQLYHSQGIPDSPESGTDRNVVEHFIDTVSDSMPRLECLFISAAQLQQSRNARCGNPAARHRQFMAREISLKVQKYRALPTCHWLPRLTVHINSETFVPKEPDEDGRLYYQYIEPSHPRYPPA